MDSAWVTAGVSTLAVITTAIYNTGGRGALERRLIRQELEVAALLPTGAERDQMERSAQDRAAVYASRRVGQEPLKPRQHAVLLGFTAVSLVVGYAGGVMTQSVRADTAILTILDSLALLMMIMGFTLAATAATAWCSRVFLAQRTRSRRAAVAEHRERLANHISRRGRQP